MATRRNKGAGQETEENYDAAAIAVEEKKNVIEELIQRAGGCAVLDGGLATQLEALGADIRDDLWSALCLLRDPLLIKQDSLLLVHKQYLEAGADIIVSSSYQATLPGFALKGISLEHGEALLRRSVELASEARDSFWETNQNRKCYRPLVAASVGSYGAYLADGSEYKGDYGQSVGLHKLKDFHRRRLQVLAATKPDLLAFETVPNKLEAKAYLDLLEEENIQIPAWICFSCQDGSHIVSGETFQECLEAVNKSEKVVAVGINCSPPHIIEDLILVARKVTKKAIIVYPNSGEVYDGKSKLWLQSACSYEDALESMVKRWHKAGANIIGGCCRTTPDTVLLISKSVKGTL